MRCLSLHIHRTELTVRRKMLYYLALLLQFNSVAPAISKTPVAELSAKFFRSVPTQVLNGLLTRFAEQVGKKYTVTEKMKTKLLAWICTLYLYVDGWSVEVATVAKDLSMTDAKCVPLTSGQ